MSHVSQDSEALPEDVTSVIPLLTFPQKMTQTRTQLCNGPLSGTTRVGWYQKKHSPTYTHHQKMKAHLFQKSRPNITL